MLAKQRNEAIRHVIAYVFTIVMVFLAVTPFIYVVLTALKTKEQIYDPSQIIPTHITFDNFRHVLHFPLHGREAARRAGLPLHRGGAGLLPEPYARPLCL